MLVVSSNGFAFAPDVLPFIRRGGEPPAIGHPAVAWSVRNHARLRGRGDRLIRRRDAINDPMLGWFAAAAIAATFARLDFFLYPSLYTEWVYVSDIAAAVYLLCWSALPRSSYWQRMSESAVLEERRRMARDLHDGLAQELAYISRVARGRSTIRPPEPDPGLGRPGAGRIATGDRRAHAPLDEPLRGADPGGGRGGCSQRRAALIEFDVQPTWRSTANGETHW